ncbi:YfdX family protein [Phaeobacter sp. HF9A]|uniref:YfdX family protein n=1 Tax=Phaeobacter sp. HF9A TaxID=2721561 RepID=UPI0014307975|nr:YfdX family protein [Phaeobacter sp. HF9A]NIZ12041.1 YfdX family protein [Phaeobacter sp. HF9A]
MKTANTFVATGLVAILGSAGLASAASAEAAANTAPTTAPTVKQEVITASDIAVSGTARNVLTGVQYARAAIDQGQTDVAKKILAQVNGLFGDQDGTVMMKTDDGFSLPVDTGLSVAEGFTPTKDHEAAFATAQTLMANGNIDQVVTTLTDAGVDLVAEIALLPYTPTVNSLTQAAADLDAGQVDQATASLDAILASVHVASFATDALPAQGYAMSEIQQG